MNKRQKDLLVNLVTVLIVMVIAIITIFNFKDFVNRSEATRAMEHLAKKVIEYRNEHGTVPPEFNVDRIKETLQGQARLGDLKYRSRWIDLESTPDEILAYTKKDYRSFFIKSGYVLLRLDGSVEWMETSQFEKLLAEQQSPLEIQMQQQ